MSIRVCEYFRCCFTRAINIIGLIDPEDLDSVLDSKSHKWDHSPRKMAEAIPELYHFLYSRSVNNDEFDKKRQKFLLERSSASMIQSSWRDHRTKRRSASLIQSFYRDYNNRPKQKSEATEADTNKPPQSPQ